ncbi:MAG: hypothetical protein WKF84_08345 [Pyrinomonadaceae bacterium]
MICSRWVLLYECAARRPAFSGVTAFEICAQIIHVDPPPPSKFNPDISFELNRVVLKALEKNPSDRYQSAHEMMTEIHAVRERLQQRGEALTQQASIELPWINKSSRKLSLYVHQHPSKLYMAFMIGIFLSLVAIWGVKEWPTATTSSGHSREVQSWYDRGWARCATAHTTWRRKHSSKL